MFPTFITEDSGFQNHGIVLLDLAGNEIESHSTDFGYSSGALEDVLLDNDCFIATSRFSDSESNGAIPGLLKMTLEGDPVWHTASWEDDYAYFNTGRQVVKAHNEEG